MNTLEQLLTKLIPKSSPEQYKKLFLISTVISLISILLITSFIISRHSYGNLQDSVIANSEKIADSIYCTEVDAIVINKSGGVTTVSIPTTSFDALDAQIRDMFGGFNVVSFAFYDTRHTIIYSTNKQLLGTAPDQDAVKSSMTTRKIVYQHAAAQSITDLYGETRRHSDIAKVFIPLKHDSGDIIGAFVISSDITELIKNHHSKLADTIIALIAAISIITFVSYAIVIRASSELKSAYQQVSILAQTDPLTGIANRRSLFDQASLLFTDDVAIQHDAVGFGCVMLDIDHFKAVNDTYGHQAGDCLLKELASQVGSMLRPYDIFGRYGGEEFLIILPNTKADNVKDIAQRLLEMIRHHQFTLGDTPLHITVSMGVTWTNRSQNETLDMIIKRADALLYQAKESGRNMVQFS